MRTVWKVLLAIVAVTCFAVALSYPIRYRMEDQRTADAKDQLIAMRNAGIESEQNLTEERTQPSDPAEESGEQPEAEAQEDGATAQHAAEAVGDVPEAASKPAAGETVEQTVDAGPDTQAQGSGSAAPRPSAPPDAAVTPEAEASPQPSPTVDRYARVGALAYPDLEKRTLDVEKILPRYRSIYEINNDLVGWITIPGTEIDYPVVQTEDSDYYLSHDFFGEENNNGQIILDTLCDPYTPSYNLVISGHNMRSDKMFGTLDEYRNKSYWQDHKIVQFDTLMERKEYVVFAAFYSADYDVDETGFRYYTDIQYRIDANQWFKEIQKYQLYDTEIEVEFGDEFLTLTTCNKAKRQDGRFVVVCRKIRKGEELT